MQLTGLHHVTAVTGNASRNVQFYTQVLGMRLVKKSVNQDDVSAYHLFFADAKGSPGTDLTFFEWPHVGRTTRGSHMIDSTGLRVNGRVALDWWATRLDEHGLSHSGIVEWAGRERIRFTDPEGQKLELVDGGGAPGGIPWERSPIPAEMQIRGLDSVTLVVRRLEPTAMVLTEIMGFREMSVLEPAGGGDGQSAVFESGPGGPGTFVVVEERPRLQPGRVGIGGVHHVAFRTPNVDEQIAWDRRIRNAGLGTSGLVDRCYFQSLYFRTPNYILYAIATDGPGCAADEGPVDLRERLALPPFLEPRRAQIEAGLRPIA
ncbi:MAG: ring-cleaving dioxygenase [Caldilineales bacterium]|nr:ring-cleaving dioxygenase [Caldilineales bacterium]